jgi:hypothetical protein
MIPLRLLIAATVIAVVVSFRRTPRSIVLVHVVSSKKFEPLRAFTVPQIETDGKLKSINATCTTTESTKASSSPPSSSSSKSKSASDVASNMVSKFAATLPTSGDKTRATPTLDSISKDLAALSKRVRTMEKLVSDGGDVRTGNRRASTATSNFVDSLQTKTFALTPVLIERFGIVSFTVLGILVGASLFDRLWLLGGLVGAYWASGVANKPNRGGSLVRKTGAQVALYIQELVEMYNQFIVFYRTGKLAYVTSKTWDKYDKQYSLTEKFNRYKRNIVKRATNLQKTDMADQIKDVWSAVMTAPEIVRRTNNKYSITTNIGAFVRGTADAIGDAVGDVVERGRGGSHRKKKRYSYNKNYRQWFGHRRRYTPSLTSPCNDLWAGPFGKSKYKNQKSKRRYSWYK